MKDLTDLGVGFLEDRSKIWFPAQAEGRASSHPGARIGDWECPECGALVYASKQACYRCGAERPSGAAGVGGRARSGGGGGARGEGLSRQRQASLSDPRFPPFTRLQGDSAEAEVDVEEVLLLALVSLCGSVTCDAGARKRPSLCPRACTD